MPCDAGAPSFEHEIQFRSMARSAVFFAIDSECHCGSRDKRDAIVGIDTIEPLPHGGRDVHQEIGVLVESTNGDTANDAAPEAGLHVAVDSLLRPCARDAIDIEGAGCSDGA